VTLAQTMDLFGFAPVLAYTKGAPKDEVVQHFSVQDDSQLAQVSRQSALALALNGGRARSPKTRAAPSPAARVYPHLGVVYGTVDRAGLAALKKTPDVAEVSLAPQLSLIQPIAEDKNSLRRQVSWGITALGIPELWAQGLTGAGVKVAHLDTGVDAGHPALEGAVGKFAKFDFDGLPVAGAPPEDSDLIRGHGTHTAATLAGRAVRRRRVGVAPGAQLYCGMVIDGGDHIARMLSGMDWAIGQGVKVLSMSLGLRGYHADFLGLIDALRDNDVLPVVAVGNEGPGTSRSPGSYPQALSVGFCDEGGAISDKSSSQRFPRRSQPLVPDVVAPGGKILSASPGGGWRTLSGSSMAVPHVAGLAALLLEAHPAATASKLERAIFQSAALGDMPRERANRGEVNGPRALAALKTALDD
jgi:subtilisin